MTTVKEIYSYLDSLYPRSLSCEWDNDGLMICENSSSHAKKALLTLDVTQKVADYAKANCFDLIISHHPLLFRGLKRVSDATLPERCLRLAIQHNLAIYSAHTSLDNAPGGVNHRIASIIGLSGLTWLQPRADGAGGTGVIGELSAPLEDFEFLSRLSSLFQVECLRHTAPCGKRIRRVALCGGSGAFLMRDALRLGADAFITGEMHYHDYFESDGMLLAELGHYQSEACTVDLLRDILLQELPELEVVTTNLNTNATRYDSTQM